MIVEWPVTVFDAAGFHTRGRCGPWTDSLELFSIASNTFIVFACSIIAACLFAIWNKRRHDINLEVNRELESAITRKEEAINELGGTVAALRRQVNHLERMRQTGLWVAEQESALRELKAVLASSSNQEASQ